MVSHNEVAKAWAEGRRANGSRMFTDGTTIYSYGTHWPLGFKLKNGRQIMLNVEKNSRTTGKHFRCVARHLPENVEVIQCDREQMHQAKRAAVYGNEDIVVVEKFKYPDRFDEMINAIEHCFKSNNARFFRRHAITKYLLDEYYSQIDIKDVRGKVVYSSYKRTRLQALSEMIEEGESVRGLKLDKLRISDSVFTSENFNDCNFRHSIFAHSYLNNSTFVNANFVGSEICTCNLTGCDLRGANLRNAVIFGCHFGGADLTRVNFDEHTSFINCYFDEDTKMDEDLKAFLLAKKV